MNIFFKPIAVLTLLMACTPMTQSSLKQMDAEAFETFSAGHTLYFQTSAGAFVGAEQYSEGRQTMWRRSNGQCLAGEWSQEDDALCFSYSSGKFCYRVEGDQEGAKRFDLVGDDNRSTTLFVAKRDRQPVDC